MPKSRRVVTSPDDHSDSVVVRPSPRTPVATVLAIRILLMVVVVLLLIVTCRLRVRASLCIILMVIFDSSMVPLSWSPTILTSWALVVTLTTQRNFLPLAWLVVPSWIACLSTLALPFFSTVCILLVPLRSVGVLRLTSCFVLGALNWWKLLRVVSPSPGHG